MPCPLPTFGKGPRDAHACSKRSPEELKAVASSSLSPTLKCRVTTSRFAAEAAAQPARGLPLSHGHNVNIPSRQEQTNNLTALTALPNMILSTALPPHAKKVLRKPPGAVTNPTSRPNSEDDVVNPGWHCKCGPKASAVEAASPSRQIPESGMQRTLNPSLLIPDLKHPEA